MIVNEEELVNKARELDPEALGTIYENYFERILRYISFRTRNSAEAEDLTEQVFLKCLESIETFKWRGVPLAAWLFRVAHNQVIDFHRRSKKRETLPLDVTISSGAIDPAHFLETKLKREDLIKSVNSLTELQRTVIELRFAASLSIAETAKVIGKSENAVKAAQHDALIALRKRMTREL